MPPTSMVSCAERLRYISDSGDDAGILSGNDFGTAKFVAFPDVAEPLLIVRRGDDIGNTFDFPSFDGEVKTRFVTNFDLGNLSDDGLLTFNLEYGPGLLPGGALQDEFIVTVDLDAFEPESSVYIWEGGIDNNWHTPGNWLEPDGEVHQTVPGENARVIIEKQGTTPAEVVLDAQPATVASIEMNDSSLLVAQPLTVIGAATLDVVSLAAPLTAQGDVTLLDRIIAARGDNSDGALTLDGADLLANGITLLGATGTATLAGEWELLAGAVPQWLAAEVEKSGAGDLRVEVEMFLGEEPPADASLVFAASGDGEPVPAAASERAPDPNQIMRLTEGTMVLAADTTWFGRSAVPGQLPPRTLTIDSGATLELRATHLARALVAIEGAGALRLADGGTLTNTFNDYLTILMGGLPGFEIAGGTLGGAGDIIVRGNARWTGGSIAGGRLDADGAPVAGVTFNVPGLAITGDDAKSIDGVVRTEGMVQQETPVELGSTSRLFNEGSWSTPAPFTGTGRFVNSGRFVKTQATDITITQQMHNEPGSVLQIEAGYLTLNQLKQSGGQIDIDQGTALTLRNTEWSGETTVEGQGTLTLTGSHQMNRASSVFLNVGTDGTGETTIEADIQSRGEISNGGRLTWISGTIKMLGGGLQNDHVMVVAGTGARLLQGKLGNIGLLELRSSIAPASEGFAASIVNRGASEDEGVLATGPAVVDVRVEFRNGTNVDRGARVVAASGTTLRFHDAPQYFPLNRSLDGGHWEVQDAARIELLSTGGATLELGLIREGTTLVFRGSGTINNLPLQENLVGGTVRSVQIFGNMELRDGVEWTGGPFRIDQQGHLLIDDTSSIRLTSIPNGSNTAVGPANDVIGTNAMLSLMPRASLTVDGELHIVRDPGTISDLLLIGLGGTVSGNGVIKVDGRVLYPGNVGPGKSPGSLRIESDVVFRNDSRFTVEAAGTDAEDFDVLHVTGDIELAGTLEFASFDLFAPQNGQTFPFLRVDGAITGAFDEVVIRGLAAAFEYEVGIGLDNTLQLTARSDGVPLPGAIRGVRFIDRNGDGTRDADESGLADITVTLAGDIDGDGDEDELQTTTDDAGEFRFDALHPGAYTVTAFEPDQTTLTASFVATLNVQGGEVHVAFDGQAELSPDAAEVEVLASVLAFGSASFDVGDAPSHLTANAISASRINLTWQDNSSNETGFKIERRIGSGSWTQVATVGANISSFQNTGLSAGTNYEYRVQASNLAGDSPYSNSTSATTLQQAMTVNFGDGAAKSVTYTDADGTTATVQLKGGQGTLEFTGEIDDITDTKKGIIVTGSNVAVSQVVIEDAANAALTVKLKDGDGRVTWGGLTADGSVKSIKARGVDIAGDVTITGLLGGADLGHLIGPGMFTTGGSASDKGGKIVVQQIEEFSFNTSAPIGSFTATTWLDSDGEPDELRAASLGKVTIAESMEADIVATDSSAKSAIKQLAVGGWLDGAVIDAAGNVDKVTLGGMRQSQLRMGLNAGVTGLPTSAGAFANRTATLKSLTITGAVQTSGASFIESLVAGWNLGNIKLGEVATDTDEANSLGVAAHTIKGVDYATAGTRTALKKLTGPAVDYATDSFVLRLV